MLRFDQALQSKYPEYSKTLIQKYIKNGEALCNKESLLKPGTQVGPEDLIEIIAEKPRYVSRAGFKLEKALSFFAINLANKTALDIGMSTGGFTDCLLQHGASKVIGIDVGTGQLHESLKTDPRITLFEQTHINTVTTDLLGAQVDFIAIDVSFISVLKIIDTVIPLLKNSGELVVLIKPQFERDRKSLSKKGVIKDPRVHAEVVDRIQKSLTASGFIPKGCIESPLLGGSGNKEFLAYFIKA